MTFNGEPTSPDFTTPDAARETGILVGESIVMKAGLDLDVERNDVSGLLKLLSERLDYRRTEFPEPELTDGFIDTHAQIFGCFIESAIESDDFVVGVVEGAIRHYRQVREDA